MGARTVEARATPGGYFRLEELFEERDFDPDDLLDFEDLREPEDFEERFDDFEDFDLLDFDDLEAPLDFLDFEDFDDLRDGTLSPSRRASEMPIAMACLRLFTFLPDPPLFSFPSPYSCITFETLF